MPPDLPTRLARKWCPSPIHVNRMSGIVSVSECCCIQIAAAVGEALADAEDRIGALYQPQRGLICVDKAIAAVRG